MANNTMEDSLRLNATSKFEVLTVYAADKRNCCYPLNYHFNWREDLLPSSYLMELHCTSFVVVLEEDH